MKNLRLVQHKPNAYTLIEFLIYISLFTFIFVLFLGVLSREWMEILRVGQKQNSELELALACDVLRRDLLCASPAVGDWHESELIIKKQTLNSSNIVLDEWIRWYVKQNVLMRAVGQYNSVKNIWQSSDVSVVCPNIKQITLIPDKDLKLGVVVGATIVLVAGLASISGKVTQSRQFYVELRNRILK